jgi:hypothetical protein
MKGICFYLIYFFLILVSCENNRQKVTPQFITIEQNNHSNRWKINEVINDTKFISLLYEYMAQERYNWVNIKTHIVGDVILCNGYKNRVGLIPAQTDITILALGSSMDPPYDELCLVNVDSSDTVWIGWIEKRRLSDSTQTLLTKKREADEYIPTLDYGYISLDNALFVLRGNYMGTKGTLFINNKGEEVFFMKHEHIIKNELFSGSKDIEADHMYLSIYGWTDDSKGAWFGFFGTGSGLILYAQPYEKKFLIFEPPFPSLFGTRNIQHAIDFNTGDIYYTDYSPIMTSRYDMYEEFIVEYMQQTFHLYKYNFFSGEHIVLKENYGKGFYVSMIYGELEIFEREVKDGERIDTKIEL